jgi:hypothetical protein
LFSVPQATPALSYEINLVTRLIDNWGINDINPEQHTLQRERVANHAFRYTPDTPLTVGLYFIDVKHKDNDASRIRPIALADAAAN